MKKDRGFTLIEIMIVVAILAVLASIAIPSFSGHLSKSRRSDAKTALLALQHAQERYRANNPAYAASTGTLGINARSNEEWYDIAITGESAVGYTATATAVAGGNQSGDGNCKKLILTVATASPDGARTSEDKDGNASTGCW